MSLFIRMAQTRQGAERLLEAQLIPTLAQCDYIDSMPESDQAFMGSYYLFCRCVRNLTSFPDNDSFLPSAIARYHQLFMPALQVVDGILAILGSKHATATKHVSQLQSSADYSDSSFLQALEFLLSHCSTIAILLKAEAEYATLALLEEIHLLVTLCALLLPAVPKTDLVGFFRSVRHGLVLTHLPQLSSNSGFGVIHAAILGLSTRCLGRGKAFDYVVPQTESEVQASSVYALGMSYLPYILPNSFLTQIIKAWDRITNSKSR